MVLPVVCHVLLDNFCNKNSFSYLSYIARIFLYTFFNFFFESLIQTLIARCFQLHHVDGLSQSGVRQFLEAGERMARDIIPLVGKSGQTWGAVRVL